MVFSANTEWHYHLVDYTANLNCLYIADTRKLVLKPFHLEHNIALPPGLQRTVQSLNPKKTQGDPRGHLSTSLYW